MVAPVAAAEPQFSNLTIPMLEIAGVVALAFPTFSFIGIMCLPLLYGLNKQKVCAAVVEYIGRDTPAKVVLPIKVRPANVC